MRDTSSVVPLRWLGESQRNHLIVRVRDACTQVLSEWSNHGSGLSLSVCYSREVQFAHSASFYLESGNTVLAIWTFETGAFRQLLNLPYGADTSSHDSEFLQQLEIELVEALSSNLVVNNVDSVSVRHVADNESLSWPSAAGIHHVFEISCNGCSPCCRLELLPSLINVLAPRKGIHDSTNLVPRRAAIGHEQVSIQAVLGSTEISFKELHGLMPGNVLVLKEMLTKPIMFETRTGQRIGEGRLGRQENKLALQVTSLVLVNDFAKRSIQ